MKIYLIPAWYPQNENDITASFFREQAHALAKRGHDVTVIHIEPLSFTCIGRKPWDETRVWQDGDVRTIYHKPIIPIPGKMAAWQDRYISNVFYRIIRRQIDEDIQRGMNKPEILHAHVSHSCGYYCLEASKKLGIPLVVTEHYSGLLLGDVTKRDYQKVHDTIEESDAFIFVGSNFQKTICEKLNIKKETYVIPNMVSFDSFQLSLVTPDRKDRPFTFLTAGHLKKNKSVDFVIKAFHKTFNRDEQVRFLIAGDGEELEPLKKLTSNLGETERISFLGRYDRKDCASIFSSADAFVLTSQVETFGIVYVEAMACGLPCIGTAGQGADDIIDADTGLLVRYGDEAQLSTAMRHMVDDRRSYSREVIRKKALSLFSTEKVGNRLSELYHAKANNYLSGGYKKVKNSSF